jgi:hypothetical protein
MDRADERLGGVPVEAALLADSLLPRYAPTTRVLS